MAKVLSLQQPWAGLLVSGLKKFETRSWNTKYRGKIYIHASTKIQPPGAALFDLLQRTDKRLELGTVYHNLCQRTGAIIGSTNIVETYTTNQPLEPEVDEYELALGDFGPKRYYWRMEGNDWFYRPLPAKGNLSIWNFDDDLITRHLWQGLTK